MTTKINSIFLVFVLLVGTSTAISPSSFITVEVQAQKAKSEIEEEKSVYLIINQKI
jgi:hypothetical protein